jgi:hypothetical protein
MARKISIYLHDNLDRLLRERMTEARGVSTTISSIVERYDELVRTTELPTFYPQEWDVIMRSLHNWKPDRPALIRLGIKVQISKAAIDADASAILKERIDRLSYPQILALLDEVERFWSAHEGGGNPAFPGTVGA